MQQKLMLAVLGAVFTIVFGVVPLAYKTDWFEQTELPKQLLWQGSVILIAACLLLIPGATRRLRGTQRCALILLFSMGLWMLLTAPFALSSAFLPSALTATALAILWAWLATQMGGRCTAAVAALVSLTFAGTAAALVGLVQDGLDHPGRFPFASGLGAAVFDGLARGFHALGLDAVSQTDSPGSLFGHTNVAAEFIAATLATGLALALSNFSRPKGRWLAVAALPFFLVQALFLIRSGSRGAILALGAALSFIWLLHFLRVWRDLSDRRARARHLTVHLATIGLLLAVGALGAHSLQVQARHGQRPVSLATRLASSFDPDSTTVRERLDLWGNTLAMVKDRPVVGVGAGGFKVAYPDWARASRRHEVGRLGLARQPEKPHNEYLRFAAEGGWPALALFLVGLLAVFILGIRTYLSSNSDAAGARTVILASLAGMAAILAVSMVGFPFLQTATTLVFYGLAGLVIGASRSAGSAPPIPWSPAARGVLLVVVLASGALLLISGRARAVASADLAQMQRGVEFGTSGRDVASRRTLLIKKLRLVDAAAARLPSNYRADLIRADLLVRLGRPLEAKQAAEQALADHPRLINAYVQKAEIAQGEGRYEEALDFAAEAVSLNPDAPRAQLALARAKYRLGARAEAHARLRAALNLAPPGPVRLQIYLALARHASDRRDAGEASRFIAKAEELAPGDINVAVARASITESQAPASAAALAAWRGVLEADALHAEALYRVSLGELQAGNNEAALTLLERGFEVAPERTIILFHRAVALRRLGRLREANASVLAAMQRAGKLGGDMAVWERSWRLGLEIQRELALQAETENGSK